jgi:hypothetical protein
MVTTEDAVPDPGVTEGEEKVHVLMGGRLMQESVTAPL